MSKNLYTARVESSAYKGAAYEFEAEGISGLKEAVVEDLGEPIKWVRTGTRDYEGKTAKGRTVRMHLLRYSAAA